VQSQNVASGNTTSPSRKAVPITCPGCGYVGHGFLYVEFVPTVYRIDNQLVRLDRPGEVELDGSVPDAIECPECRERFAAPATLEFTERCQ
jgi:hypothetical protein